MHKESKSIRSLPKSCDGEIRLHIPEEFRRGALRGDEKTSIESAVNNLKRIATLTERDDFSNLKILDYGCGVKFSQALIQYEVEVRAFVGMDVFHQMIKYLNENVTMPNFEYHTVPFRNEMYNKNGVPLTATSELPGDIDAYDLFTLQSVFTHFNPTDFLATLQVLRRYAARDARMLFTCFIDNDQEHDFVDSVPGKPLLRAFYKEMFIREMLEASDWKIISLQPPGFQMQHQFICEPQ